MCECYKNGPDYCNEHKLSVVGKNGKLESITDSFALSSSLYKFQKEY